VGASAPGGPLNAPGPSLGPRPRARGSADRSSRRPRVALDAAPRALAVTPMRPLTSRTTNRLRARAERARDHSRAHATRVPAHVPDIANEGPGSSPITRHTHAGSPPVNLRAPASGRPGGPASPAVRFPVTALGSASDKLVPVVVGKIARDLIPPAPAPGEVVERSLWQRGVIGRRGEPQLSKRTGATRGDAGWAMVHGTRHD
jgi:hypothetical protein